MKLSARLCKVNQEIALKRSLTEHTVRNYLIRIFDKLGISSRVNWCFMPLAALREWPIPWLPEPIPLRLDTKFQRAARYSQQPWRSTNTGESKVSHPDLRRGTSLPVSGQPRNRMGFCASAGAHTRHQRRRNVRRSRRCALGGRGFSRSSDYGKTLLAGVLGEARGTRAWHGRHRRTTGGPKPASLPGLAGETRGTPVIPPSISFPHRVLGFWHTAHRRAGIPKEVVLNFTQR